MPKYVVIADDFSVDSYLDDTFYGAEIVECDLEQDALSSTEILKDLVSLQFRTIRVADNSVLGWYDDITLYELYQE